MIDADRYVASITLGLPPPFEVDARWDSTGFYAYGAIPSANRN